MKDKIVKILAILLSLCIITFVAYKVNQYLTKDGTTPVVMTLNDAKDKFKLKEQVNKTSNANLNDYQAGEVSDGITKIVDEDRKPNNVIHTTGKDYKIDAKTYAESKKTDAVVITPKDPNTDINNIKSTDNVVLNQYNIQAYPKHQFSVAHYTDGDTTIDYETQVKLFGKHMYIGPTAKLSNSGKAAVGIKLTIPF